MAYVTVSWEYGDVTTIDGFRVYRDDVLRADITDTAVRTYDDDSTGFSGLRATYKVIAYDSGGRTSTNCATADVEMTYKVTPIMTSQNTPSGEVTSFVSTNASQFADAYKYFDGGSGYLYFQIGQNPSVIDTPIYWNARYTFSSLQTIARWGFQFDSTTYDSEGIADDVTFELYGSNINSDEGVLIDSKTINIYEHGEQENILFDLIAEETYSSFIVRQTSVLNTTNTYNMASDRGLMSEIYLMGRPA